MIFNYVGWLTKSGAILLAESCAASVSADREYARSLIYTHGDALLKRWRRDRNIRKKLSMTVYAKIPAHGTPLVEAVYRTLDIGSRISVADQSRIRHH